MSALDTQVGGDHYKKLKIQPVEYIHANAIPFIEGCIIKYASRWRGKGGLADLEKIKHFAQLLIDLELQAQPLDPELAFQDAPKHATHKVRAVNSENFCKWAYLDADVMRECSTQYKLDMTAFEVIATRNQ